MSLRNLSPQTMVNISEAWLDAEKDREVFAALPLLGALLPAIEEAHEGIKRTQRLSSSIQNELKALLDQAVALDTTHDRKLRGTYNFLGSVAEMTDDSDLAKGALDLRDRLVPVGLKATTRSYGDQAGDAKLLPSRLDDASTKLLKKLKIPGGQLSDVVEGWRSAALELEAVDAKREKLTEELPKSPDGVTPRDVHNARNAWIRVVRAVETNAALEKGATEEVLKRLFGRLRRDEAKADRRAAAGRKDVEEEDEEEGGGEDDSTAPSEAAAPKEPPKG
jgi:hypothetical protein